MGDFSRVCLRNCGSGGVVDVPASKVRNIFPDEKATANKKVLEFADDKNRPIRQRLGSS